MRRILAFVAVALVAIALSACGKAGAGPSLPDRPAGGSGVSGPIGSGPSQTLPGGEEAEDATGSQADEESDDDGGGNDQGEEDAEVLAIDDDLKVFAYATSDETSLAAELADMAVTFADLESDLASADLDAARADARTLLEQAETLGADAEAAEQRQKPLEPEDAEMVAARKDAIDAFGLTAEYATAVTDIANAVLDGQLTELVSLAQDAAALAGTSDDLTQAYADLNAELVAWAEAHPTEAALALAKYGDEG